MTHETVPDGSLTTDSTHPIIHRFGPSQPPYRPHTHASTKPAHDRPLASTVLCDMYDCATRSPVEHSACEEAAVSGIGAVKCVSEPSRDPCIREVGGLEK